MVNQVDLKHSNTNPCVKHGKFLIYTLCAVVGEPCVENVVHGFNACCMVYGQTGSGKTYTMLGELGNGLSKMTSGSSIAGNSLWGLAPRMLKQLFSVCTPSSMHFSFAGKVLHRKDIS